MFRRSNKECRLVFSMKYLLFQGRFGRDERFPFERDERFRSGECGGRRRSKGYVISDGWETPGTEMICRGRIVTSATIQQNGE